MCVSSSGTCPLNYISNSSLSGLNGTQVYTIQSTNDTFSYYYYTVAPGVQPIADFRISE